jgi:hypothetical protein
VRSPGRTTTGPRGPLKTITAGCPLCQDQVRPDPILNIVLRASEEFFGVRPASMATGKSIPNGRIVRGSPDVKRATRGRSTPDDIDFADVAIEVCDGLPSDVERSRSAATASGRQSRQDRGLAPGTLRPDVLGRPCWGYPAY